MIKVTVITTKGCSHCENAKQILNKLKAKYDLKIEEVDVESNHGQKLAQEYRIMSSPGILINDKFFSMGGVTEEQLRTKFNEFKK